LVVVPWMETNNEGLIPLFSALLFCAMKRGSILGVNIAPNTASRGYRSGEQALLAQADRTLDIAPNTLP